MKLTVRNLGRLAEATIDLDKDLILLTGPNNTSKTYVAHAIYGLCKRLGARLPSLVLQAIHSTVAGEVRSEARLVIDAVELVDAHLARILGECTQGYRRELPDAFAAGEDFAARTDLVLHASDEQIAAAKSVLYLIDISQEAFELSPGTGLFAIHKASLGSVWTIERVPLPPPADTPAPEGGAQKTVSAVTVGAFFLYNALSTTFLQSFTSPFILTAERSAVQLFSRELSLKRDELVDELLRKTRSAPWRQADAEERALKLVGQRARRYPEAIRDSLAIANDLATLRKSSSPFAPLADRLDRELLGGAVRIADDGDLVFQPDPAAAGLSMHLASSSVKSLAGLSFFLRHIARERQILIIDEPELNLHPDNQRRVARVLARLARSGIKVLISTHSDYIIREINNLIMLSADQGGTLHRRHGYDEEETLTPTQVGAYLFDTTRARPIEVTPTGIEVETIDREINALNAVSQDIYFSLFEQPGA